MKKRIFAYLYVILQRMKELKVNSKKYTRKINLR
jgi:hypothetical protein